MAEFSTQMGATTQKKTGGGWGQSLAVQAGVGSGLQQAKLREQREQFQKTFNQSKEQFDVKMGWEKAKADREMAFAEKQQKYTEKKDAKSERIAMFGSGLEFGKLALTLNTEEELAIGSGPSNAGPTKMEGGTTVKTSSQPGGDPSIDSQGETVAPGSASGASGSPWYSSFTDSLTNWAAGTGTGAMAGSHISQAVFGEGKTQSTAGGAVGGGVGGYYGSGGNVYGGVAGAAVGGILGYLLG